MNTRATQCVCVHVHVSESSSINRVNRSKESCKMDWNERRVRAAGTGVKLWNSRKGRGTGEQQNLQQVSCERGEFQSKTQKKNRPKERGEGDCGSGEGHRMNLWVGLQLEFLHKGWGLSARALQRVWHLAFTDWQNHDQGGIKEWREAKKLGTLNTASLVRETELWMLLEQSRKGRRISGFTICLILVVFAEVQNSVLLKAGHSSGCVCVSACADWNAVGVCNTLLRILTIHTFMLRTHTDDLCTWDYQKSYTVPIWKMPY